MFVRSSSLKLPMIVLPCCAHTQYTHKHTQHTYIHTNTHIYTHNLATIAKTKSKNYIPSEEHAFFGFKKPTRTWTLVNVKPRGPAAAAAAAAATTTTTTILLRTSATTIILCQHRHRHTQRKKEGGSLFSLILDSA